MTVPAATPDTTPVVPTVATEPLLLLQAPPETELLNVIVLPTQTEVGPVIVPGSVDGLTVTFTVALVLPHPFVTVYEIVVVPVATPLTTPELLTVATDGVTLVHAPPDVLLARVTVAPWQTVVLPVIALTVGKSETVTTFVARHVPGSM